MLKRGVRTWRQVLPGHWEGDLLSGPNNSYIATLASVIRVMLAKVAGKDTQTVVSALIKQAKKLPKETVQVPDLGPGKGTYRSSSL